jgi:hypothetical protein
MTYNQVLYQLSYTGARVHLASLRGAINGQTCDIAGPRLLGGRGIRRDTLPGFEASQVWKPE